MACINEIYNKNIMSIKKVYPHYYDKLMESKQGKHDIEIIEARDGNRSMAILSEGKKIFINSKYRPLEEAEKWSEGLDIRANSVIVVFGFGMGYRIKELTRVMSGNNVTVVIEPDMSIIKQVISFIDITDVIENSNVCLYVGSEALEYKKILNNLINWRNIDSAIFTSIPNYKRIFSDEYSQYLNTVKEIMYTEKCSKNTINHFSQTWQSNLFKNIPYVLRSNNVINLFNKFMGKPVIIVSAGPSLNKNVDMLKEVKEKAVIICVGTALKTLLKKNIKPDLVISIDGGKPNYEHFKDIEYSDIPLVYSFLIYPEILKKHKGEKFVFLSEAIYVSETFNEIIKKLGIIKTSGTVAFAALDLAQKMGANPIIFIGQDLAYTQGRTHATGTVYEDERVTDEDKGNFVMVEDIYGNKVMTSNTLYVFLTLIQDEILADDTGRVYIDATEGGAKIKGTQIMTFKEAVDMYCKENIEVTNVINESFKEKKIINLEELRRIIEEFRYIESELELMRNKCGEGEKLSLKLADIYLLNKSYDIKRINKILTKLNEIDDYIKDKKKSFLPMKFIIEPIMIKIINNEVIDGVDDKIKSQEAKIALKSKFLYKSVKESINNILPILKKCIQEIEDIVHDNKN